MTAKYKIKINQGATLRIPFTWKSNGTAIDITGFTARMQIRKTISSTEIIHELTTENGGIILGDDGAFLIYISDSVTKTFNFTTAVYDLEFVNLEGDVIRLLEGAVQLSLEVTRNVS